MGARLRVALVSVHDRSTGRASMARAVARDLVAEGHRVMVVAHAGQRAIFSEEGVQLELVADHIGPLVRMAIRAWLRGFGADRVVLFDFFGTVAYLARLGVDDPTFLYDGPWATGVLDTWVFHKTGHVVDYCGGSERSLLQRASVGVLRLLGETRHRLIPAPVAPPSTAGAFCALLPEGSRGQRAGWPSDGPRVLTATGTWQHDRPRSAARGRVAAVVPRVLAGAARAMGARLTHVGPAPWEDLGPLSSGYDWCAPCGPRAFDALVSSADLVLSANVSATTNLRAMRHGVPVLLVQNPSRLERPGDVECVPSGSGRDLGRVVRLSLPLEPFVVWPLGYQRFLGPVLRDNPLVGAMEVVRLGRPHEVLDAGRRLLRDGRARTRRVAAQREYVDLLDALPRPARQLAQWTR